jgi:hypothetical protein
MRTNRSHNKTNTNEPAPDQNNICHNSSFSTQILKTNLYWLVKLQGNYIWNSSTTIIMPVL